MNRNAVKILATMILLFAPLWARADIAVETWECFDHLDLFEKTIILTLARFENLTGTVQAAGVTNAAIFSIRGLNRRWNWGEDESGYQYSIILEPDGTANYFDFTRADEAKPTQFFECDETS